MTNEDWNDFWFVQMEKNKNGSPRYSVTADIGTWEDIFVKAWIEKWQNDFLFFDNVGCGCCINMYEFDAPESAVDELRHNSMGVASYDELNRPIQTGQPSSFLEFSRSIEKSENEKEDA